MTPAPIHNDSVRSKVRTRQAQITKRGGRCHCGDSGVVSATIATCKGKATHPEKPAKLDGTVSEGLDARTTELIAIGASVAAHCQPCLSYHVATARDMGIAEAHIREAMAVGHRVEKGSVAAMQKFSENVFVAPAEEAPACCGGTTTKSGKKCCG